MHQDTQLGNDKAGMRTKCPNSLARVCSIRGFAGSQSLGEKPETELGLVDAFME